MSSLFEISDKFKEMLLVQESYEDDDDTSLQEALEKMLLEWLEQNSVSTETVVGLSYAQVGELADYFASKDYGFVNEIEIVITDYLKTQAFAQTKVFSPNWDDAPDWTNWLAQDSNGGWYLYKNKPQRGVVQWGRLDKREAVSFHINPEWIETLQQRQKPPTPQVEVGQVWYYGAIEATVKYVNDNEVVLLNNHSGKFYVNTMPDFIAKFERGGSE